MKKCLCSLVILCNYVNAGGTHLISLRESGEVDFSKKVHFKGDEQLRYSASVAQEMFARLHSSEERQIVEAWMQIVWLKRDKATFDRMQRTDRWNSRGERVEKLLGFLVKAPQTEKSIPELYEQCYKKTEFKDRYVPGCGNKPMVLMRPDKFFEMMSSHVPTLSS